MADAAPPDLPSRDRRTSFEILSVPAEQAPRIPWRLRLGLLAVIVIISAGIIAFWRPPAPDAIETETLTWEQIAPPATIPMRPWRWLVIHHSATRGGDPQAFDHEHAQVRGWEGIGYHFVIGNGRPMPLGRIEATFRWRNQMHGAHAGNAAYNQEGLGLCLVGDFDRDRPDPYQERRLVELCAQLIDRIPTLSINRIVGHRDVRDKATSCPGRFCDVERLRFLVRRAMEARGLTQR